MPRSTAASDSSITSRSQSGLPSCRPLVSAITIGPV
jgi:hypothetical protein